MVLDIVVGKEREGRWRHFPTRYPQSLHSRGGDGLPQSFRMTRGWMARLSMRSARRGSTAGLRAPRAALIESKFSSSFNLMRRNEPVSGPAGAAILARRAATRKRISFAACATKSQATRTAHFLCGTLRNSPGVVPPICSAPSARPWGFHRGNMRTLFASRASNPN